MNSFKKIVSLFVLLSFLTFALFALSGCAETTASVGNVYSSSSSSDDYEDEYEEEYEEEYDEDYEEEDEDVIYWDDAKYHVGEYAAVVGVVAGSEYAYESNGQPTFLDLGVEYPDPNRMTVLIWGENRDRFSNEPETYYLGKTIEVYGEITMYNGVPEIIIDSEDDIYVLE